MYQLSPEGMEALQAMVAKTVEHTIETFMAGARIDPRRFFVFDPSKVEGEASRFNPADEWRKATLERYREGSWKRTIIELMPFAVFRPSEFYAAHSAVLAERYPSHRHPESGLANTLAELLRDGVLAKVGTGLYAPAVNGVRVV